jgi:hypothetical protein
MAARRQPWHPAAFEAADADAVKALANGAADGVQQKRAFDWIMDASGVRNETFVPGADDVRCYLLGRRSIGLMIAELVRWIPPKAGA